MLARIFKNYSDGKYAISDKIITIGPNTDITNLSGQHKWLTTEKLVIKPDQLIKRRGKNNLSTHWPSTRKLHGFFEYLGEGQFRLKEKVEAISGDNSKETAVE